MLRAGDGARFYTGESPGRFGVREIVFKARDRGACTHLSDCGPKA